MAEAVFSIAADITPQINERELERQASTIAGQLNGMLSKQVNKVGISAEGNFRPFQAELDKSRGLLDKFQGGLNNVPKSVNNIARAGRGAFLKFTDAINVTRREFVGFGTNIRDTIRNTNMFEDALDNIKATGSTISDLPDSFQNLAAQVRSGTSYIDQAAASGDKMAQMFQPIQRQGEAARGEFVELNRSVDTLTRAIAQLARAQGSLQDATREVGKDPFVVQVESVRHLQELLKGTPNLYDDIKGSLDKALLSNSPDVLLKELTDIKNEAQKTTGPLGRIAQLINEKSGGRLFKDNTRAARELAIQLEQGTITSIRKLFGSESLGAIENFNARFRETGKAIQGAYNTFNTFRTGLANLLPGASPIGKLVDSIAEGSNTFKLLRMDGVSALQAINQGANEAWSRFKDTSGLTTGIAKIKSELAGLGLIISQTKIGAKINESLGQAGSFIERNLTGPLRAAGPQMKAAFSGIGRDITNGLGVGIESGKAPVLQRMRNLGSGALEALRTVLRSHSDSKEAFDIGHDTASGYAHGAESGQGMVNKALKGLGAGLKELASQAATFFKSVAAVGATTLAGLGAVALKTGLDFNVLKQVIGSTLPVLVGSKEASAALLVEVNKLNDSSPYARSSFLELTRVLAGFGVEAAKITPLIDAIQQTVAATGGSDQDLLELGQAFAKIQSQGRVTGEILQSFSVRGVDAVAVLASGFGKTTAEMKAMISDGLVPADKAITVLTTGLKAKFDGATDAVAKNFPGALQRVQARLRDIGGTLLTAFINPAGGGALVDFLNNMADALGYVNRELLPKLAPALVYVGNLLVGFSEKVKQVVTSLSSRAFGDFVNKLGPWLPLLAGLAGLAPAAFGWVPVVGPLIAGLGGPFTAVAAAIAVFLVQSGHMNDAMKGVSSGFSGVGDVIGSTVDGVKDHLGGLGLAMSGGASVVTGFVGKIGAVVEWGTKAIPVVSKLGEIFGKLTSFISKGLEWVVKLVPSLAKLTAEGSKLSGGLKILTGPVGTVAIILAQLIMTSQRFRDSLMNLWQAVQPTAHVIGQVFAVAVQILDGALKALEPVFTMVVNLLAGVFHALNPVIKRIGDFLGYLSEHDVISKFFDGVKFAIEGVIKTINGFIDILDKALGPFINLPELNIDVKTHVDDSALKKSQDEAKKKAEELKKAAKASGEAITDNFNKASKAVEMAKQQMDGAVTSLTQGLASIDQKLSPLFDAAKAVKSTAQAVVDARQTFADAQSKATDTAADLTKIYKDQARAFEDVISPVNELAVAQRGLTRIQNSLRDSQRELDKMAEERAKLTGEEAAQNRAGLARAEERAQINLNRAKQAELDLLDELNGKQKVSLDLSGLTLDQIRARLAAARLSNKAARGEREKTPQEIEDSKKSANLDVQDAEQGVRDAKQASLDYEADIKIKIRDIDEKTLAINADMADTKLEEQKAQTEINRLRAGESALAQTIKDFDEKIRDAKKQQATDARAIETASKGIQTATEAAKLAGLDLQLQSATIRGNTQDIAAAQQAIWKEKQTGLTFDDPTLTAIGKQKLAVQGLLKDYQAITAEVERTTKLQASATSLQAAGSALATTENLGNQVSADLAADRPMNPITLGNLTKARNDVISSIRAALAAGAAEIKSSKTPAILSGTQIENIIRDILNSKASLRDAIRDALNRVGLSMPGFAAAHGYAPGDYLQRGQNNGVGLMRWAEWGKEAVLPLTRKFDMARVVQNPSVLPAILDALPRWSMPTTTDLSSSSVSDLSTIVRSGRASGPANSDVYEKKSQRDFANTIGEAVRVAIKEAIAESDGLGGADVDINVMPSSANEVLIAREVKRQVAKALGKRW